MYDDEKQVRSYNVRRSPEKEEEDFGSCWEVEDFGLCWGEELLDDDEAESKKKPKSNREYSSFYLHGRKYCLNDTVYILSGDTDGPPYIGRIGKLYENVKDKEKQMQVRWFCRPCEMPEGLPDVDYSENCKEVFLMWGSGSKNINNPASTLRRCSVLCTADEEWNTNVLSIEEIAAADHIFDRAYDLRTGTLRSLDSIVKYYGEHLVLGTGGLSRGATASRASGRSGRTSARTRTPLDHQPLPLAICGPSDDPLRRPGISGRPALVTSPNSTSPANSKRAQDRMIPKAASKGSKRPLVKTVRNSGTLDSQKRPKVDRSNSQLSQQAWASLAGSDIPSVARGGNKTSIQNPGANSPGNAAEALNREGQKATLNVLGKQTASIEKKRSRATFLEPIREIDNSKKPKLSIPLHAPDVGITKNVSKVEAKVPLSTKIGSKLGELRSPKELERNPPANNSGSQQARQSPTVKKQFSGVTSPSVRATCSAAKAKDKKFSNLDQTGNQNHSSSRARLAEAENVRLPSPKVVNRRPKTLSGEGLSDPKREAVYRGKKQSIKGENVGLCGPKREEIRSLKEQSIEGENVNVAPSKQTTPICFPDPSSQHQASEDVSPMYQKSPILKFTDLEQEAKFLGKSSVDGLERRTQSSMHDDFMEANPTLPQGRKLYISSHKPGDEDVSPTSSKRWNGIGESRVKHESFLGSKRAGSSLEDSRHAEGVSPHIPSKKRPASALEVGTRKKTTTMHSDSQPLRAEAQQVREQLKVKRIGLVAKDVPRVLSTKQSDQTRSAEPSSLPPQGLANKGSKATVQNNRISDPDLTTHKDSRAAALDTAVAPPEEPWQESFEPKKKIFNFPWEQTLHIALEQGKALVLQNLDPWFSSAEIEANLQELLRVSCDVRMLPPKNFTCYTSGQALVLFRSQNAAEEALMKFTENLLIWSNDERIVLASLAHANTTVGNRIYGFYNSILSSSRGVLNAAKDQKNSVATSHCSQPNTVEYEMGIQWRLLQDRHAVAWAEIAGEDQNKVAIDHPIHESKPKRS